jgi:hypothetical protein
MKPISLSDVNDEDGSYLVEINDSYEEGDPTLYKANRIKISLMMIVGIWKMLM